MQIRDKIVVVTGGGHGIGRGLCLRFAQEEPKALIVADLDGDAAQAVAEEIGAPEVNARAVDVSKDSEVVALVDSVEAEHGPIDLFCSNAGINASGGVELSNETWERVMGVNVYGHLYAARTLIPRMIERGGGYLLQTVSAAGMLTQIGSAPYAVTKHAALALAEWISVTHGDEGIKVSCLCPQGVRTRMLLGDDGDRDNFLREGSLSTEEVAEIVVQGLAEERFLILPHPEVATYEQRRTADRDRWLAGMRRLQAVVRARFGTSAAE